MPLPEVAKIEVGRSEEYFDAANETATRLERAITAFEEAKAEILAASVAAHRYNDELIDGHEEILGPTATRLGAVIETIPDEIVNETYRLLQSQRSKLINLWET